VGLLAAVVSRKSCPLLVFAEASGSALAALASSLHAFWYGSAVSRLPSHGIMRAQLLEWHGSRGALAAGRSTRFPTSRCVLLCLSADRARS